MTPEEWQRAREILAAAILQPAGDRSRHIAELCGQDQRLGREIVDILDNYGDDPSIAALIREEVPPPVSGAESPFDGTLSSTRTAPRHDARSARGDGAVATWGEYTLLDEIGRGGFGVVHRAWDGSLKRDIALKVIDVRKLSYASEDTVLREGQMLARVRHPNVVTVYSARRIGREVGLAMEYIKGRTLSTLIAQQGVLNAHEAVHYGLAVCDALAAVHREGLVHRDLKASNVMREEGGRIVLMDFGAGREVVREPGTWSGLIGTPAYMPPEVLRGERATPSADIYSLGVLLFHLVTGRYPVANGSFEDVVRAHASSDRLALSECRPDLPGAFVDVVERAMHAQADKRPQTAAALRRELEQSLAALSGRRSVTRNEVAVRYRTREKSVKAHRVSGTPAQWSILAAAAILLCGIIGFVTTLEFNAVLGRTAGFAMESRWAYFELGVRAMIAPVVYMSLALLVVNTLLLVARIVGVGVPRVKRALSAVRERITSTLKRFGLYDPTALGQAMCLGGGMVFILILVTFQTLVFAFASRIDDAPADMLAVLHTDHRRTHVFYGVALDMLLLALICGLFIILRANRRQLGRSLTAPTLGLIALICLTLLFVSGPWRILFASKFRQAVYDGRVCVALGQQGEEVLLHCPTVGPRRNRFVRVTDPRLEMSNSVVDLFDSYVDPGETSSRP